MEIQNIFCECIDKGHLQNTGNLVPTSCRLLKIKFQILDMNTRINTNDEFESGEELN